MGLTAMSDNDGELLDEVIVADLLRVQITQALEHKVEHESQFISEECASKRIILSF